MTYFLDRIAQHLYSSYGDGLREHCIVFPNRRAGLYFLKYLGACAGKPVWSPSVKTINELFTSLSDLKIASTEVLVFELYKTYRDISPEAGTFDDFYFWGEMILNDFDNIDKYLVDAVKLFENLSDIRLIDQKFGSLTDEQKNVVKQFWINFNTGNETRQKADFLELWKILPKLYSGYRESLSSRGFAYEGMIFREIAERSGSGTPGVPGYTMLHFAGFNALNTCEKTLLRSLSKANIAKFYWDYDITFIDPQFSHSAGFFIRDNLKEFGNDMPADWTFSGLQQSVDKDFKLIDSGSDIGQVKMIPQLLGKMKYEQGKDEHHTAIVLADEALLIPVLSTVPDFIKDLNITMGYPLKFSPIYSFVSLLLNLQRNAIVENGVLLFAYEDIIKLLKHTYIADNEELNSSDLVRRLSSVKKTFFDLDAIAPTGILKDIFIKVNSPSDLYGYLTSILRSLFISNGNESDDDTNDGLPVEKEINNEFIYRAILALNSLMSAVGSSDVTMNTSTFIRLVDKILRSISIPFSGEPLNGIQVMGILETRALDFRNIIILSANEGVLPRSSAGASYIPHNLREAFGLPVLRHQDSIYSYYFYRLLQRAESVTFIYNSSSEGLRSGEMSRFLLQLMYLGNNKLERTSPHYEIVIRKPEPVPVPREDKHQDFLIRSFASQESRGLSPSAVNTWLNCRMKFYYKYICAISEPEKPVSAIDHQIFGKMLHGLMHRIYSEWEGKFIAEKDFDEIINGKSSIQDLTMKIVKELSGNEKVTEFSGSEAIVAGILQSYCETILKKDRNYSPLKIDSLERYIGSVMMIEVRGNTLSVRIGGYTDRIDQQSGIYRIIDYKTGSITPDIISVSSLLDESDGKRNDSWFQILMYCEMLAQNRPGIKIRPGLYAVRKMGGEQYSDKLIISQGRNEKIEVDDYSVIREEFSEGLKGVLRNIFDPGEEFRMTEDLQRCRTCTYSRLCRR